MDELINKIFADLCLLDADIYGHLLFGKYGLSKEQADQIHIFVNKRIKEFTVGVIKDTEANLIKKLQNPPL